MHPLLTLILQIAVVLAVSRAVGIAFRWISQPQVVGEMVAGICLGPSLLGWLSPDLFAFVFPVASLGSLKLMRVSGDGVPTYDPSWGDSTSTSGLIVSTTNSTLSHGNQR